MDSQAPTHPSAACRRDLHIRVDLANFGVKSCDMTHLPLTDDLRQAVDTLRRGGIIIYPTDTIWGIGCDATNPDAVARVYRLKQREDSKALITLVSDIAMLERYVADIPDVAYELLDAAVSPLTVIYDRGINLAPNLLAADGSVGIRIPADDYASRLCRMLRRPIVSTSANISGAPSPALFSQITPALLAAADYVAYHRRDDTAPHRASSIIKLSADGQDKIIR